MDAFVDLENPPYSVQATVQNSWLPTYIQQTVRGAWRHRIETNQKYNSKLAPLKLMSSRMSPRASQSSPSIRHPGKFPRQFWPPAFFVYKYKTSENVSLRNRQMSLKGQMCRGNLPWWRIFGHAHWKKGAKFSCTRVGLPVDLYFVVAPPCPGVAPGFPTHRS